nr:hypothetical protein [Tanacetum cinerariifolium]
MIRLRAASPPPVPLPPLLLPSTAHRDDIPRESSAVAARRARHALTSSVDYKFIDTVDASICTSESRAMTIVGEVNERVTDLAIT